MVKQKRVTATVKMTYSEDTDLIAWWNSIPRGSRNAVMKDMMREYIARQGGGFRPIFPRNLPQPFDPGRFTQLCEDASWIRDALLELPTYVEHLLRQVAVMEPSNGRSNSNGGTHQQPVSDDAVERREQRMQKAQW